MNLHRNVDITTVLNFLESCKSSRLLADPNVTTVDNQPATISIVTEIPYQELTQTSAGGNIGTTGFKEAGVKLVVTPRIASDGTILMDCTPSFSRLTGFTPGDQPQPIIDRREAKTMIRVADRQTLVVGGLRQRSDITDNTGLPYLKDIKKWHIGKLFSVETTTVQESELVVFIMPEIITPYGPNKPREELAKETANCYLDRIPQGEGCPPNVPCENGATIDQTSDGARDRQPQTGAGSSPIRMTTGQRISSALGVRTPAASSGQLTNRPATDQPAAAWSELPRATHGPKSYDRDFGEPPAAKVSEALPRGAAVFPGPPPRPLPPVDRVETRRRDAAPREFARRQAVPREPVRNDAERAYAANKVQPLPPVWEPSQPTKTPASNSNRKDGSKNWLLRMLRI
jgi:hypothetical protein